MLKSGHFVAVGLGLALGLCALRWLSKKGMVKVTTPDLAAVGSPDAVKDQRATLPVVSASDFQNTNAELLTKATIAAPQ